MSSRRAGWGNFLETHMGRELFCDECGGAVDLDGDGLEVSDAAIERAFCSHVCAIHQLTSDVWNALLDATDAPEKRTRTP